MTIHRMPKPRVRGTREVIAKGDEPANDATASFPATRAARMVTTSAGITIGIAHMPRLPQQGSHADAIQRALLAGDDDSASCLLNSPWVIAWTVFACGVIAWGIA